MVGEICSSSFMCIFTAVVIPGVLAKNRTNFLTLPVFFCGSNRTFLLNFSVLNYSLQYHISILTIYKQSYRCVCTDFDMDIEDRTQSYYRSNWLCVLAKLCWKKPENITVPLPFPPLSLNKINILSD